MNKVILIVVILALAIGGYFILTSKVEDQPVINPEPSMENEEPKKDVIAEELPEMSVKDRVMGNPKTKTGKLEDVSGGNSSGTGYVLRGEKMLYHYAAGNLPDPQGSNKYEGWLVKQKPELLFFSTGLMTKEADGSYTLSYTSEKLSEGYDFVVITEETVVDAIPEKHIIEGTVE